MAAIENSRGAAKRAVDTLLTVNSATQNATRGGLGMLTKSKRDELRLLINSRQPIITVETSEEERLETLLFDVATEMDVPLFSLERDQRIVAIPR